MMRIAALLTVHNRKEKTLKCLRALKAQKLPLGCEIDVYLTDDGCTDGTPEAIASEFPEINIVKGDGNLFWNRGMYRAWEAASNAYDYDWYLWLNDDTTLLPDALNSIIEEAIECPDSVIVGSTYSTTDPYKLTYGGQMHGQKIYPDGSLQQCETFNGNIVLISRSIFHLIGNLDWTYEHAIGDLDYGWMVTHAGRNNYISRGFRGICDNNSEPPVWMRPEIPFRARWANFHSPLGYSQPTTMFYFNYKNFGIVRAVKVMASNHLRLIFPRIWARMR